MDLKNVSRFTCILVCSLFVSSIVSAQTVYRWEDERGVVHFSDSPPRGAQNVKERRMPSAPRPAVQGTGDEEARLDADGTADSDSVQEGEEVSPPRIEIKSHDVEAAGEASNEFSGEVENVGGSEATDVIVIIDVTETNQGAHCLTEEVAVSPGTLGPGEKGSFSVHLSNPCFYGDIKTDIRPDWN